MAHIFFIVGLGRSTTALLADSLALHPQLSIAPESTFALDLHRRYGVGRWTRKRIDAFCKDLAHHAGMREWHLDMKRVATRLYERESTLSYEQVCRQVYTSYAEDTLGREATAWVADRNPSFALHVEALDRIFPQARYIHVTRDYRDQIHEHMQTPLHLLGSASDRRASYAQAQGHGHALAPRTPLAWLCRRLPAWSSPNHPVALAQRWKEFNRRILELSRRAPERSLWLRYEDLLSYPEHELARICRFLDVPADVASLAADAALLPARTSEDPLTELRRSSLAPPWQQLPEATLRQAESICGEFAERFGYRSSVRGEASLGLSTRLLTLYGSSSVLAERVANRVVPVRMRVGIARAYRRLARPLRGGDVSGESSP
jgi:hypothetical protein